MHKITNLPSLKYEFYYPKKLKKKETHNLLLKKEIKEEGRGGPFKQHTSYVMSSLFTFYIYSSLNQIILSPVD